MRSLLVILSVLILAVSCGTPTTEKTEEATTVSLTAAGATFPLPYYNLVFKNYTEASGILVTYGGIGSGGGIRSLKDKVVDFGATDAFIEDDKMSEFEAPIVHIPTCIGAVVIGYNLKGINDLKLSNKALEGIFMGKITQWNDPQIAAENAGVKLPALAITLVYRSDGSGTTHIFSDYMSKISTEWESSMGRGKSLEWKTGIGAKGNPGVAGTIQQTEGTIGYIGSEFAFSQQIQMALVQNSAGNYIKPSDESISLSAQGEIPADTRVMLTNSSDANAYPISGFTWIILYKEQAYKDRTEQQAIETVKFLNWLISPEAQQVTTSVHYSPLPQKAVDFAKTILQSVTYNGKPVLK